MLQRLQISNYALIDSVDITFHSGFNVITGETGAGKSIMLGALSLLLGGRADTRAVRRQDAKSVIEAVFRLDTADGLETFCGENDIDWDPEQAILRREITPTGRSRAFINDTPVTVAQLREAAIHLVDIHSQHQNLLLADPAFQLRVLDHLAGNAGQLDEYRSRYRRLRDAVKTLKGARERLRQARDDEEYTRFQLEQLEELKLADIDEQQELEQRREVLENLTHVKNRLQGALEALDDSAGGAVQGLRTAATLLTDIAGTLPDGRDLVERLESAAIEVADIADTVSAVDDNLQAEPGELEQIEERLNAIYSMQTKHHVDSVMALMQIRDDLRQKLAALDDADEDLSNLEKEARRAMALVKEAAAGITASRQQAAQTLAEELRATATPLGMKNLRVEIAVTPAEIGPTGADKVEFLFAFNKNQPLLPVANTASGGEISRLMLSLKAIISGKVALPSIIFDEIDTGVSGDVANRMGDMMAGLGERIQVIAITHLPQVAARGKSHFKVYKEDDDTATHTRIAALDPERRIDELSLMLSGSITNEAAREAAKSMLRENGR